MKALAIIILGLLTWTTGADAKMRRRHHISPSDVIHLAASKTVYHNAIETTGLSVANQEVSPAQKRRGESLVASLQPQL